MSLLNNSAFKAAQDGHGEFYHGQLHLFYDKTGALTKKEFKEVHLWSNSIPFDRDAYKTFIPCIVISEPVNEKINEESYEETYEETHEETIDLIGNELQIADVAEPTIISDINVNIVSDVDSQAEFNQFEPQIVDFGQQITYDFNEKVISDIDLHVISDQQTTSEFEQHVTSEFNSYILPDILELFSQAQAQPMFPTTQLVSSSPNQLIPQLPNQLIRPSPNQLIQSTQMLSSSKCPPTESTSCDITKNDVDSNTDTNANSNTDTNTDINVNFDKQLCDRVDQSNSNQLKNIDQPKVRYDYNYRDYREDLKKTKEKKFDSVCENVCRDIYDEFEIIAEILVKFKDSARIFNRWEKLMLQFLDKSKKFIDGEITSNDFAIELIDLQDRWRTYFKYDCTSDLSFEEQLILRLSKRVM